MVNDTIRKAVILFSGGVDSTTLLAMLLAKGYECYALTINYGQRHAHEINAARNIATSLPLKEHKVINLDIASWGGSSLTDHQLSMSESESNEKEMPTTYVPARNSIFLTVALGWAEAIGAYDIYLGANKDDHNHYPDCRPEFIDAFNKMANTGTKAAVTGHQFIVHAPLLHLTKTEIIATGLDLAIDYSQTVSCYNPAADGAPCQHCEACHVRIAAFDMLMTTEVIT